MDKNYIVSKMNTYMHSAADMLANWLNKYLPRIMTDDWWSDCVIKNLSNQQREIAERQGFSKITDFDLAALLRIAYNAYFELQTVTFFSKTERACIRDMAQARNNWAHCSVTLPGKDIIIADLETFRRFFVQMECDDSVLNEIDDLIEAIKTANIKVIQDAETNFEAEVYSNDKNEVEITEKSLVYLTADPSVRGIVMSITDLGYTIKYTVFVNGSVRTFITGQIMPVTEVANYNWVDINTFRSYLAAYQINNPSSKDLYSLNAARIDFVPYQFRPALKMLHADEPRILIADSVGVGKTIEAGLIIKELQARNELENILIVCPKALVAERKWELEMKRFDEDFVSLDGELFRQILSDTDRDGEWPVRYNKAIIPYSILDGRAYNGEMSKKGKRFGLKDLDPAPHFDLVIIDEAHHIRNGSMDKEKAFEYKCVKYFCDHADAVVMLTATPLQTSDDDLFTLLNVLRPDIVIDKETFTMMSKPNEYISKCVSIIRKADNNWQNNALEELENVKSTQWGEVVISKNPLYTSIVNRLGNTEIGREERVKLISDTESLHSFNTMLNRTRRKDIQDFCIRRPYTLEVEFTPQQQLLHDELLNFEKYALAELHGSTRNVSFMMSTIKRQAASCIFGLAPHIRDIINRRFTQLDEDFDHDYSEYNFDGHFSSIIEGLAQNLLELADNLPEEDPKFDNLLKVLRDKKEQDNNKIIIFSTFRFTLKYLHKKLEDAGFRVAQVDGSVKDVDRQNLRARFQLPKEDVDAIDIMLFSEVGSEGLDYQFCDMMVNYDLPWNPMRIEQRIGRIDRRGQQSESVSIYHVITKGTVDADIYYRCLLRIGVFENSIGECDEILGSIANKIDQIAIDPTLTAKERQLKLEQMADNEIRKLQEITKLEEEEQEIYSLKITEYTTAQEIRNAENAWLSPQGIQVMIEQYLNKRFGQNSYILGEGAVKHIRLRADIRAAIKDDLRKLSLGRSVIKQDWDKFLKGKVPMHAITFDSEAAAKNSDVFFITPVHPLAKLAADYFTSNDQAYIRLQYATNTFSEGKYYFSVYAWKYVGLNPSSKMVIVCEDDRVAAELYDILQEAKSNVAEIKINPDDWNVLEDKHLNLLLEEKAKAIQEANVTASVKIEGLNNNFINRKRSLEQRILDSVNDNIKRMYTSELEIVTENHDVKLKNIAQLVSQTDIHTTLIANGVLEVMN